MKGWYVAPFFAVTLAVTITGCGNANHEAAPKHTVNKGVHKTKRTIQGAMNTKAPKKVTKPGPYSAPPAKLPLGNVADGSRFFASACASCHGRTGTGTASGPRLAKPSNVITQFKTETALESFILHNMPADNPGTLSTKNAANAAAYVWHIAGGK